MPDWAYAKPDNTFGNRWDDPDGMYRVLYAGSQPLGTLMGTVGRFRPDGAVIAELDAIEHDEDPASDEALRPGQLPRTWLASRRMGEGSVEGDFVDIGHSTTLTWLHFAMA